MNTNIQRHIENNVELSVKDSITLKEIESTTWESEIAKNSLIALIDEHEPPFSILSAKLLTILIMAPIILFKVVQEFVELPQIVSVLLIGTLSLAGSILLTQAVFKILKMHKIKKNVYNKINGSLLDRNLNKKEKSLLIFAGTVIFILLFIIQVFTVFNILSLVCISIGVLFILIKAIVDSQHYHFILSNAAFLLGHIQRELKN